MAACPAIPGCVSQGPTQAHALANIKDAMPLCLEVRAARGLPLTMATSPIEVGVSCRVCQPAGAVTWSRCCSASDGRWCATAVATSSWCGRVRLPPCPFPIIGRWRKAHSGVSSGRQISGWRHWSPRPRRSRHLAVRCVREHALRHNARGGTGSQRVRPQAEGRGSALSPARAEQSPAPDTGERGWLVAGVTLYCSPVQVRRGVRLLEKQNFLYVRSSIVILVTLTVLALLATVGLAILWARDPTGNYEPWTVISVPNLWVIRRC